MKVLNLTIPSEKLTLRDCQTCRPLIDGWCGYVETATGQMLDEKCPRVAAFINFHVEQNWRVANKDIVTHCTM